ncbi:MAG: hypothetical protein K9H15_07195, partial [Bacteroidales bacterium]|nr:hypothetical protein [Bacteroidales bacterium]
MKEGSFFKNQSIINAKTKNKLAIKTTQTSLIAIALSAFTACLSAQSIDINQNFSSVAEIFSSALSDCDSAYNTTYVTRDIIWNNNNVFIGDVTVNSDVNLTIKSTIGFGENASLNILPGARVVIDSGKLTKACSGLWQGIDVYGYPFTSQSY